MSTDRLNLRKKHDVPTVRGPCIPFSPSCHCHHALERASRGNQKSARQKNDAHQPIPGGQSARTKTLTSSRPFLRRWASGHTLLPQVPSSVSSATKLLSVVSVHEEGTSVVADELDWIEEERGGLQQNHCSGMQNRTEGGRLDDDERTLVICADPGSRVASYHTCQFTRRR